MKVFVDEPGARTSVQDRGRFGYGAHGVPCGGAMDQWALRAANALVGNGEGDAALECTLLGPTLRFEVDTVVALTGARADLPHEAALPHEQAFIARAGEPLRVGRLRDGARCIVAIRGGLATPLILGSRSALPGAHIAAGDALPIGPANGDQPLRRLKPGALTYGNVVRAIAPVDPGIFAVEWTITPHADRSGLRLAGSAIAGGEIEPEGAVPGVIQVPPDGSPIILGPDGPATGGYTKIATIIAADVGLLASFKPGDTLRFMGTTIEQARAAWLERQRALREGIEDLA